MVQLPPLRDRPEDVDVLSSLYLERYARELGKGPIQLSDAARALLRSYEWPGNVRELRNLMERAAVLSAEPVVAEHFFDSMIHVKQPPESETPPGPETAEADDTTLPLAEAVERYERRVILRALSETGDNKAEAARRLGVSERNLWYKLKKHGL
jgi:DNA-binding NtrC family response regulator